MINRIIAWSVRNRLLVVLAMLAIVGWGIVAAVHAPIDAIPDLSDNQVIVFTSWPGRSPQVVEDQITFPLETSLEDLPGVRVARGSSNFGYSMVNVVFKHNIDLYWARTRVLERLSELAGELPAGVTPTLGPDGTGVGQVFWYVLRAPSYDLGTLRAIQDWYLRLGLQSVPGVAEVASMGGFVRQYQVIVNPIALYQYGVSVNAVGRAIAASNNEVGGGLVQRNGVEFDVRGLGYLRSLADLRNIVVKTGSGGVPVTVGDVATVQLGGAERRGAIDWNGHGEAVGGIIVMRSGANPDHVINRVKAKLADLARGLPAGVTVVPAYDRSTLIERAIATLRHSLFEEAVIVSLVVVIFLLHVRSALVVILTLPVAVLMAFIAMKLLGIGSNIMSLGGIAIAVGVLVDAGIVMVENAHRHLANQRTRSEAQSGADPGYRLDPIVSAAQQVGRPIFFSLAIIVLSFAPVFMLTGQEGKLFKPLAYTKTFSMAAAALLSITLVPALMTFFLKGRFVDEANNPVSRFFVRLYRPVLATALRFPKTVILVAALSIVAVVPVAASIGREFMPPLDEGTLLYMPTMLPDVGITEATRLLQVQDRIIKGFPEVASVLGKVGRADTATDPAPISMTETLINLRPQAMWPAGETKTQLVSKLDAALQIPGVVNAWTQPIINRINMLTTGVRTDLGLKIFGPDLSELERLSVQAEGILKAVPGAADVYADRVTTGRFLDITPDRRALARYGMTLGNLQDVITVAIGGQTLTRVVDGRYRFPVVLRYGLDFRDTPRAMGQLLVPAPGGLQIPLASVARVQEVSGPTMINSENGMLRGLVSLNVRGRDLGSFMDAARAALATNLRIPSGYYLAWSGQYKNEQRAAHTLGIVIPVAAAIILLLLFFTFRSWSYAFLVVLSVPFALVGGVVFQKLMGYDFSVAVAVGYLALSGIAVETGVIMLLYLDEAMDRQLALGRADRAAIHEAVMEGAVLRLRPKLMTVAAAMLGLTPLLWATGAGSDVMRPIAAPMIGGLLTSMILVLLVLPVLFVQVKTAQLKASSSVEPVLTV